MKIAIIHDWLVTYAGAERVLEQMLKVYPDADLFSLVDFLDPTQRDFICNKSVKTSFIQKLPFAKKAYRNFLPLMPLAIEQLDVSGYDVVISSSHAVSKGVITGPDQLHICMCYSPIRYAWDLQHQYLKESALDKGFKSFFIKLILHYIRIWDRANSQGVNKFISISNFISKRISKFYGRSATVIYPPVDINKFSLNLESREDFYVTCSRMVPYKKIDLIVETFSKKLPDKRLVVIGDGPDMNKIKKLAKSNIEFLGHASSEDLMKHISTAKAFIFAAHEDFGIAPIEAQSCGTPVIAYGSGGALETIIGLDDDFPTGVFFEEQSINSLYNAVILFEKKIDKILPNACRKNSERFSNKRFRNEFKEFTENLIEYKRG
jgi:glycosyltransferase involved in cell wall biosynthesis